MTMDDKKESLFKYWWLALAFLASTVIFIYYYAMKNPNQHAWGISWKENPLDILLTLFGGLLIASALLDQFIEVFFPEPKQNQNDRNEALSTVQVGKAIYTDMKRKATKLKRKLVLEEDNTIRGVLQKKTDDAEKETSLQYKRLVEQRQIVNNMDKERRGKIRRIAFVVGLVLALAGVRVLTPLIMFPETTAGDPDLSQYTFGLWLISYCDMIFTACLLSGGTSGVNRFFSYIKTKFDGTDTHV